MAASAVYKVENGERRVDVDDLVAFAFALNVTPNALLLPDARTHTGRVQMTARLSVPNAKDSWIWATWEAHMPPWGYAAVSWNDRGHLDGVFNRDDDDG